MLSVTPVTGAAFQAAIPDLARLRMTVFRAYPYLYDGDLAYEERYLQTYLDAPGAFVALARDGERIVGASTAVPLSSETEEVQRPFLEGGLAVVDVLYLGESVLLPEYRGRGIGHRFFDLREAHAASLGLGTTAFCAVVRPEDHPARPAGHRPLNEFWQSRGYVERPDLSTHMTWREVGAELDALHPMRFWVRAAGGSPRAGRGPS